MPVHFSRFRETRSSAGIILVSQDLDIGAAIDNLLLIWTTTVSQEWLNHLGFIPL
jgi:hypothetical protein